MNNIIKLSDSAVNVIINLQHSNGTYCYYADTLSRLINFVLHQSDEIGMSDCEAMATLRALHSLQEDLGYISGIDHHSASEETKENDTPADVADKVEAIFCDALKPNPRRDMLSVMEQGLEALDSAIKLLTEADCRAKRLSESETEESYLPSFSGILKEVGNVRSQLIRDISGERISLGLE